MLTRIHWWFLYQEALVNGLIATVVNSSSRDSLFCAAAATAPPLPVEPLFDRAEFWSVSGIDSCCLAAAVANDSSGRWRGDRCESTRMLGVPLLLPGPSPVSSSSSAEVMRDRWAATDSCSASSSASASTLENKILHGVPSFLPDQLL